MDELLGRNPGPLQEHADDLVEFEWAARAAELVVFDLAEDPLVATRRSLFKHTVVNRLESLALQLRIGKVDLQVPAGVVERLDSDPVGMLPVLIALLEIPLLEQSKTIHCGPTFELSGRCRDEAQSTPRRLRSGPLERMVSALLWIAATSNDGNHINHGGRCFDTQSCVAEGCGAAMLQCYC